MPDRLRQLPRKRKATWIPGEGKRHVGSGWGEHDLGWWRKKANTTDWLHVWIQVLVWDANGKMASDHNQTFEADQLTAAKRYARQWIEQGGVSSEVRALAGFPGIGITGGDTAVIFEHGEYRSSDDL